MIYADLSALRTLVAIADEGTFDRAALRVRRTQAAVSQQMRRLESQLEVKLFRAAGRGRELTPAGREVLDYARRMLSLHEEMFIAIHDPKMAPPIRFGSPADLADTVLPEIVRRFFRSNPSLAMQVNVGRSPDLMAALHAGEVDLTVSTRWEAAIPSVLLRTSPIVWIAADDFHMEPDQSVPLVLTDEPSIFRSIALKALDESGRAWSERYVSPGFAGVKAAVHAGIGITARSIEMVAPGLKVLGEREKLPELGTINYYLYLREDSTNQAAQALFKLLSRNG